MPMVWDEQHGAMVWEEDVATPTPATQQAAPEEGGIMGMLKRVATNPLINPLGAAVQGMQGGIVDPPQSQLAKNVGKAAPLPLAGSIIGGKFGGKTGMALGGAAGEWANQQLGLTPPSKAAMVVSALPGPASRKAIDSTKHIDSAQRTLSGIRPYLGVGLAEEAYNKPKAALEGMLPPAGVKDAAYDALRNDPRYRSTPENRNQYPWEEPRYPIDLSNSRAVAAEQNRQYAAAERTVDMPATRSEFPVKVGNATDMEGLHASMRRLNTFLRNPGTADANKIYDAKQQRAALWRDAESNALTPQLKEANRLATREMAVEELSAALESTRQPLGKGTDPTKPGVDVVPNIGPLIKKMEDTYSDPDNPFIRSAIAPNEFYRMIDEFRGLLEEQKATKSNVGSLAAYGAAMGAGGGAGSAITDALGVGAGPGGLSGSILSMLALRGKQEAMTKEAISTAGAAKRAQAVKRFRTPAQAWNIPQLPVEAAGQLGAQSIAEMFLRSKRIDPTLQPSAEDELPLP